MMRKFAVFTLVLALVVASGCDSGTQDKIPKVLPTQDMSKIKASGSGSDKTVQGKDGKQQGHGE